MAAARQAHCVLVWLLGQPNRGQGVKGVNVSVGVYMFMWESL